MVFILEEFHCCTEPLNNGIKETVFLRQKVLLAVLFISQGISESNNKLITRQSQLQTTLVTRYYITNHTNS